MNRRRVAFAMLFAKLEVNQCVDVVKEEFDEAYEHGWPSIYPTARESFLSKQVGSGYGAWTCTPKRNETTGRITHYIVCRREIGERRVYVDPDKAHLFEWDNGELVRKDRNLNRALIRRYR